MTCKVKGCSRLAVPASRNGWCLPCIHGEPPGAPEPAVHRNPTDTEAAAAALVAPRLGKLQRAVLASLTAEPAGLTPEEMADRWGWEPAKRTTIGPRCTELRKAGLIVDSGLRRKGPHQGSPSIVWRIA